MVAKPGSSRIKFVCNNDKCEGGDQFVLKLSGYECAKCGTKARDLTGGGFIQPVDEVSEIKRLRIQLWDASHHILKLLGSHENPQSWATWSRRGELSFKRSRELLSELGHDPDKDY